MHAYMPCRLKELMGSALLLPAGVAASAVIGKSSVQLATALVSDDNKGSLLGAAVIEFSGDGLEEVVIF